VVVYGIPVFAASVYIVSMIEESPLRIRYEAVRSSLDERGRRLNAAAEAKAAGYGGIAAASRVTKPARSTIGRRKGGGSPRLATKDPTLLVDLERFLKLATMGDPMRALRWVFKSHDKLATALRAIGHKVSSSSIPKLLGELKYCRHSNRKTKEGGKHPDRDAQFEYINAKVQAFQADDQPVISIDAKKQELLGEFKKHPRFRGQGTGQSRPLRGLRHRRQRRLPSPHNHRPFSTHVS
jgi:hypothetical protein